MTTPIPQDGLAARLEQVAAAAPGAAPSAGPCAEALQEIAAARESVAPRVARARELLTSHRALEAEFGAHLTTLTRHGWAELSRTARAILEDLHQAERELTAVIDRHAALTLTEARGLDALDRRLEGDSLRRWFTVLTERHDGGPDRLRERITHLVEAAEAYRATNR